MEFNKAESLVYSKDKSEQKFTTARIKKIVKSKLVEMGVSVNQAVEWYIYWQENEREILKAIMAEIKRLGDKIDELENVIIGKSDQRGY